MCFWWLSVYYKDPLKFQHWSPLGLRVDSLQNVANIIMSQWVDQCLNVMCHGVGFVAQTQCLGSKKEEIGFVKILAKALSVFVTMEWVPPLDPKVKVNFVVAMIEDVGTGLEVIFSNSKGETMASGIFL